MHALTSQCQPFNSVNPGTECQQKTLHETISSGNQSGGPVRCILHSRASELYIGELLMSLIVGKRNCLVFTDIAVTNWEEVFAQIRTNEWVPSTMEHGWMFPTPFFLCLSYIKVISCSSRCVYFEWKGAKCFSPCLHSWHCNNKHEGISETGKTRVRTIQRVRRQALLPTVICWDRLTAAPVFVAS